MKPVQVTWGRSKSKDYQSRRASVTIELESGDTLAEAFARARAVVDLALDDLPSAKDVQSAEDVLARHKAANALLQTRTDK